MTVEKMVSIIVLHGVALLSLFSVINGQLPHIGKCPERSPLQAIDVRKLVGLWYESQRTPSLKEWPYKCISFKVEPFYEHKSSVKVTSINRLNGKVVRKSIPLHSLDVEGRNGKISANISSSEKLPLQLLAYGINGTSWCVLWSCRSFQKAKIHTETVWVLTRERGVDMDRDKSAEIQDALVSLNLEHLLMRDSLQSECTLEDEKN